MFNVLDIRDQALNVVPHPPTLETINVESMQCMQAASSGRDSNPEHILKILLQGRWDLKVQCHGGNRVRRVHW